MTQSEPYATRDVDNVRATVAKARADVADDVGSRAADRFADLYAEAEHDRRATRYDRAITQAREE